MSARVAVTEVTTRAARAAFLSFPSRVHRDVPAFVPPLLADERAALTPHASPLWDEAKARLFLARVAGRVVGRIALIASAQADRALGRRELRFGWFDCIDDADVADALFARAADWARALGVEALAGPQGFCGFDRTGLLVEGFDRPVSLAGDYHPPHYEAHLRRLGFEPTMDTVEHELRAFPLPAEHRLIKLAEEVMRRRRFRLVPLRTRRDILAWGVPVLELLDEVYEGLWGAFPLSARQRAHYVAQFFPYLDLELVKLVTAEDGTLVGFVVCFPALAEGFRRAGGHRFPFGLLHLHRAAKRARRLEIGLGGVRRSHRGLGVELALGLALNRTALARGFTAAEVYPQLETNTRVQGLWSACDPTVIRRRRLYRLRFASTSAASATMLPTPASSDSASSIAK